MQAASSRIELGSPCPFPTMVTTNAPPQYIELFEIRSLFFFGVWGVRKQKFTVNGKRRTKKRFW